MAGVALILLTTGLCGYIDRLGLRFGKALLVLALGYNAPRAVAKLGLAPAVTYAANRGRYFEASPADPNSPWFYLGVSSGVLLLCVLVFGVMYGVFERRMGCLTLMGFYLSAIIDFLRHLDGAVIGYKG